MTEQISSMHWHIC